MIDMNKSKVKAAVERLAIFLCGTRRVIGREGNWRVVCATCEAGGTVRHYDRDMAIKACMRDSIRRCRSCGAK